MTSTDCFSYQTTQSFALGSVGLQAGTGSPKIPELGRWTGGATATVSSSTFLFRFFHSLFVHEIVDRGLEQLRRSAKDLLRLMRNGRVDDLFVDAFRDALFGLGGVLQHSHMWTTLMVTRKSCMAKMSSWIFSTT